MGLLTAPVALADPPPARPGTSAEAQQAWQRSARDAEVLTEKMLDAKLAQQQSESKATAADKAYDAAARTAHTAAADSRKADAAYAAYQAKVDAFANASFRGARLSQIVVIFTANTPEDYLQEVTSLDQVAADTQKTLDAAVAAKGAAQDAKVTAERATVSAQQAKTDADAAATQAASATKKLAGEKDAADAQVAEYKRLYDQLSAAEREALAQAAAQQREQQQRMAAAALAAQRPAAAAVAAANAAPAQAAAPAPPPDSTPPSAAAPPSSAPQPPAAGSGSSAGEVAARAAMSKIGAAYVWAATGPGAFDCSGLTMWAWAQAGVSLPHSSAAQAGYPVVPLSQLQPGDLVTYYSPTSHVAIYVGNGMVVSASTPSTGVVYVPVGRAGPNPVGHRVG